MTIVPSTSRYHKCTRCGKEKLHGLQDVYLAPACMDCMDTLFSDSPSRKVCHLCGIEQSITHFDTLCGTSSRACIPCVSALPSVPCGMRRCSACFEGKPPEAFPTKGGWCILCTKAYRIKYYRERSDFEKRRNENLRHNYGITLEDYELMLFQQAGVCAACGQSETTLHHHGKKKPLSVDHNHATGQVRGLLCHTCNVLLGHLENDPQRIKALQKYLKKYT